MRAGISSASAALALGLAGAPAWAAKPVDGQLGFQEAATPVMREIAIFHNYWLMPLITAISVLVLVLLLWVIIAYRRKANPTPSKFHHNTLIEVIWTAVPAAILVVIAIPSFKLLYFQDVIPEADMTVKAVGYQWYWGYEYPDHEVGEFISAMAPEEQTTAELYRLAVDQPMVAPAGATVRVLVTAADVIHNWAMPAFGVKMDAIPGRLNETWFRVDEPGTFYGQCSELCGVKHAFMPIQVEIVPQPVFDRWAEAKAAGDFDSALAILNQYKAERDAGVVTLASAD